MRKNTPESFWKKVQIGEPDQCWPFMGKPFSSGYGQITFNGRNRRTHQVAYELTKGPLNGMMVLHTCDNRICCNPRHLYLGTHQKNMDDMVARARQAKAEKHGRQTQPGRTARGERHGTKTHPETVRRGQEAVNAVLTAEQVAEARLLHAGKLASLRQLARRYGVGLSTIARAVNGKTYAITPGTTLRLP